MFACLFSVVLKLLSYSCLIDIKILIRKPVVTKSDFNSVRPSVKRRRDTYVNGVISFIVYQ